MSNILSVACPSFNFFEQFLWVRVGNVKLNIITAEICGFSCMTTNQNDTNVLFSNSCIRCRIQWPQLPNWTLRTAAFVAVLLIRIQECVFSAFNSRAYSTTKYFVNNLKLNGQSSVGNLRMYGLGLEVIRTFYGLNPSLFR